MAQTIERDIAGDAFKQAGSALLVLVLVLVMSAGLIIWKSADAVDATTCAAPRATAVITTAK